MAATTHRGITYTGTGTYTQTVNFDLPLWAGQDQDETGWLDGQSTDGYPGNLSGFQATNTQVAERNNPRLISLTLNSALADTNTLTLSGDCSKILSVVGQHEDATAIMGITKTSDLVLTFALKQHDDSAADVSATELWLLVV
tara:strand:- start:116 stop:541 length:426 start_codon:yes stop_codon:yes gene_type:complete